MAPLHVLDGIRVADFTTMLNGPYTTILLSDMGADVIKVEPPDGDPWRIVGGGFMAVNRGKRSIAVDLKKGEAKEVIHRLIASSDIMVENARWGVWHRLGLDYDSVARIRPDIIYVSVLGHGSTGPYSGWPAYDPLLQCRSGQMVTQGGIGKPPVFHAIALNDLATPMLGAYGAMLALYDRTRTGKGQHVETSLTNASVTVQSGDFIDYPNMKRTYPGDTGILGLSATYRQYQGEDGRWFFVLCAEELQWRSLCRAIQQEELLSDLRFQTPEKRAENDEGLAEILAAAFADKPAADWVQVLRAEEVPVVPSRTGTEVLNDPYLLATGVLEEQTHPEHGWVKLLGVVPRFSGMSGVIRRPAPLLGEHTEEVLRELAFAEEQITELKTRRVTYYPK
ncbi:CaiB/BaiF CoA transferase family protein [Chloroflexota bacterium]